MKTKLPEPPSWPRSFRISDEAIAQFRRTLELAGETDQVIFLGWMLPAPDADLSMGKPGFSIVRIDHVEESVRDVEGIKFAFLQRKEYIEMYDYSILQFSDESGFELVRLSDAK